MNNLTIYTKVISILLASLVLFTSCASSTVINSKPSGAKVYIDGESKGVTPYTHKDTKIVGSTTTVKLEKEKHITLNTSFNRDEEVSVGALIGGLFFLVPFLWVMKYKPTHTYELKSDLVEKDVLSKDNEQVMKTSSRYERIYELKRLLDENLITKEEFDIEKKKILTED